MKFWLRAWKVRAIEAANPRWDDLAVALGFDPLPPPTGIRAAEAWMLACASMTLLVINTMTRR